MADKEYKAVIFDLGGVYFLSGLMAFEELSKKDGFAENRFLNVLKKKYLKKIETGKILDHKFWHKYKMDVGSKIPIAEVKRCFFRYHRPTPGMKELVRELRKNVKVGLLTNNVSEWYKLIDKRFKISKEFDSVVVSADVRVRKPNKKIYKIMAHQLGVDPSDCIFVDDYHENIIGGNKAGMTCFKFKNVKDMEKILKNLCLIKKSRTKDSKKTTPSLQTSVSFKVNGKKYSALPGTTVLKALGENGFYVPTLCYAPIFPSRSNCRICMVEIKGIKNLQPACSTEIKDGMEILLDTDRVQRTRKTNLKLLYQDHIGKCATCIRLKNCELLRLVSKYQAGSPDFKESMRKFKKDTSGAVVFDFEKCIKCGRCIEACKKYGSDVLKIKGRGFSSIISTKNEKPLNKSGCISCLQCAAVCPVGAIYIK